MNISLCGFLFLAAQQVMQPLSSVNLKCADRMFRPKICCSREERLQVATY